MTLSAINSFCHQGGVIVSIALVSKISKPRHELAVKHCMNLSLRLDDRRVRCFDNLNERNRKHLYKLYVQCWRGCAVLVGCILLVRHTFSISEVHLQYK